MDEKVKYFLESTTNPQLAFEIVKFSDDMREVTLKGEMQREFTVPFSKDGMKAKNYRMVSEANRSQNAIVTGV